MENEMNLMSKQEWDQMIEDMNKFQEKKALIKKLVVGLIFFGIAGWVIAGIEAAKVAQ